MKLATSLTFALALCVLPACAQVNVKLGNEVLAENGFKQLAGKRAGLITNPSGVNSQIETVISILHRAPEVNLVALFGPEHGIYGDVPAGDRITDRIDELTGLPVYSLYGATRKPAPEMLKNLDVLIFDIQDIGCRSYTYISTMGLAMEAAAEAGIEFVVLDRPNPLGGERIEGPRLEEKFRSFVSQWDVPYVHGLTIGELAKMINGEGWISKPVKLTVVPMEGWKRSMVWRDTGLLWVPTSPHVPHGDSPMYLVATGIVGELGGINIGVGYTTPFQTVGAPGVDMHKLSESLNGCGIHGVKFQPLTYRPYYAAFREQTIAGSQLYLTDPRRVPLTALNFYILEALKNVAGYDVFAESLKARRSFDMFDKVCGTDAVRKALQEGKPAHEIVNSWKAGEDEFRKQRQKFLLYR